MDIRIIEERIQQYQPKSKREELNAFKEVAQEITLLGLNRSEFFKCAGFQGGTCLRIVYGLNRFSEDLDFILFTPDVHFVWQHYLNWIKLEFESFGLSLQVQDRSEITDAVKKAFLKEDSFGKVLQLSYKRDRSDVQTALIKLEIDTNPPRGSDFETKIVEFPTPFSIAVQSKPSLFAGKLHALLCRSYVKGRDWYDFVWYVTHKTKINYSLLQQALLQQGPWQGQKIVVSRQWLCHQLQKKILEVDWDKAKQDAEVFLKERERESLKLWDPKFFQHFTEKIILTPE